MKITLFEFSVCAGRQHGVRPTHKVRGERLEAQRGRVVAIAMMSVCVCRYWILDVSKVYASGSNAWDTAVHDASEEYKHRMVTSSPHSKPHIQLL